MLNKVLIKKKKVSLFLILSFPIVSLKEIY